MSRLVVSNLSINRAELPVVSSVDLTAESGAISVVLGANGAGKTTLLEGLSGIIPVAGGAIAIDGRELQKARPGTRSREGLAHVEQGRTVFRQLTTEENLRVSLHPGADIAEAYALFPELVQRRSVKASLLSGGEQQMLVIARALLTRPKVLLIDEMSAGLAPVIVTRLMTAVRKLADDGLAVVLVEQFAALALSIGNRAYVMRRGRVVYDGDCAKLRQSPDELHRLYLGGQEMAATS
ncbi:MULTISPECIES: ABC transporter ATP-binding protein [unclassified Mesorhizobium]|uniref:ABC transporter ATP-binding protein n=1 Tax=unclassified Mesorhizobium TaxID=325217 RepID=UPI00112D3D15|nr:MULTISPECIES: ABC transporter ATP-binding protein [unclassified Mesorhizobium]TPL02710.1 ABC transporter ATP-binding protein [Mesorhizobium sp. B2-4-16]TPL71707.1 ABC transporter ATP-binding protein [Mesorhizobium sp. B2-4-3]